MTAPTTVVTPIPTGFGVKELIGGLLGRDVEVAASDAFLLEPTTAACVAIYVDERVHTAAVCVLSLELAASLGAGLALLPPKLVTDAAKLGELTDPVRDNLYEILNIMSSLLNADGAPHVKLYDLYTATETPPRDVQALARMFGRRLDLEVEVVGYGSGRLALVIGT